MKRSICSLFCAVVFAGFLFSQSKPSPDFKIGDYEFQSAIGTRAYFLNGFDFEGYNSSYPSLAEMTAAEFNFIKSRNDSAAEDEKSYTVIGYSQGGLRALAYAAYLEKKDADNFKNLEAVITVSGIDQGMQALDQDLPGIKARMLDRVEVLEGGLDAYLSMSILGQITVGVYQIVAEALSWIATGTSFNNNLLDIVAAVMPNDLAPYLSAALRVSNSGKSAKQLGFQQLDDMRPGSDYVKNNVIAKTQKSYRVADGEELVAEIRFQWGWLPYIWIGYKTKYKTVTVDDPAVKFDPDIPVGFIVGTKNSLSNEIPSGVRNTFSNLRDKFSTAYKVHIGKSCLLYGLLLGCPAYANKAAKAYVMVGNLDGMVNYVTRSYDGDGLVARANQYIPQKFYNRYENTTKTLLNNVLTGSFDDYIGIYANHREIEKHKDITQHMGEIISMAKKIRR